MVLYATYDTISVFGAEPYVDAVGNSLAVSEYASHMRHCLQNNHLLAALLACCLARQEVASSRHRLSIIRIENSFLLSRRGRVPRDMRRLTATDSTCLSQEVLVRVNKQRIKQTWKECYSNTAALSCPVFIAQKSVCTPRSSPYNSIT